MTRRLLDLPVGGTKTKNVIICKRVCILVRDIDGKLGFKLEYNLPLQISIDPLFSDRDRSLGVMGSIALLLS